jgi:hypothetical protein
MTSPSKFGQAPLIKFDRGRKQVSADSPLATELKGFIDRVIVPILLQSYLAQLQSEKQIAESDANVALCDLMNDVSQGEVAR